MKNDSRHFSVFDRVCLSVDQVLRTLSNIPQTTGKPNPAKNLVEPKLSYEHQKHAAGLMRVNHAGEICAQALYHGQSLVSRNAHVRQKLQQAALEEGDHLAWCNERIAELGSHTSYLNPVWYAGSFCIGMAAGMVDDQWSLGFVAETERQVIKHLGEHVEKLPQEDIRSYCILKQMELDETKHCHEAMASGAKELPSAIKKLMALTAKLMVKTAYWV